MSWLVLFLGFPYVKSLYFEQIPMGPQIKIHSLLTNGVIETAIYNQVVQDWNNQVLLDYPHPLQMIFNVSACNSDSGGICLTDNDNDYKICEVSGEDDPLLAQTCYRRKRILGIFPTDKIEWAVIYMPHYDSTHITWNASPVSGKFHGPTIVRHEIAHAVGLGHDRDDLGSLLMKPILPAGEYRGIDSVVRDAVYCKYGPPDTYIPSAAGQAGIRVLKTNREEVKQEKEPVACPIFQIGGCAYVPPSSCDMDSVYLEVRDSLGTVVHTWSANPDGCTFWTQWMDVPNKGRYRVQATVWFSGNPVAIPPIWVNAYPGKCLQNLDEVTVAVSEEAGAGADTLRIQVIPGGVRLGSGRWNRVEVWDVTGRKVTRIKADPWRETRIFLKRGVYVLRVYQNDEARTVRKIVIP